MKALFPLTALLVALLLCACDKPAAPPSPSPSAPPLTPAPPVPPKAANRTVTGQVFIVRKDAVNVKLGGIEVVALEWADAEKRMREAETDATADPLQLAASAACAAAKAAETESSTARAALENATQNLARMQGGPIRQREHLRAFDVADAAILPALRAELAALRAQLAALKAAEKSSAAFQFFKKPLPIVVATTTDAEGRLTIQVPSGRQIVLACRASRRIVDETEHYHWLVTVAETQTETILSNSNLLN